MLAFRLNRVFKYTFTIMLITFLESQKTFFIIDYLCLCVHGRGAGCVFTRPSAKTGCDTRSFQAEFNRFELRIVLLNSLPHLRCHLRSPVFLIVHHSCIYTLLKAIKAIHIHIYIYIYILYIYIYICKFH